MHCIRNMSRFLILLAGLFFLVEGQAQRGWEAGGWLGTAVYFGDLNNRLDITRPGIAGGVNGRFNFNTRICAKSSLSYARLSADDADSPNNFERDRNLSFSSNVFDLTNTMEFNFFPYVHGHEDYYYTPYLLAGFSIFRFNPKAELNGQEYNLREHQTELVRYGNFSGGLTVGGGWKVDLNRRISINIEFTYRRLFTDYFDDVSSVYPNETTLLNQQGQIGVDLSDRSLVDGISGEGRQRGNSKDNDSFSFLGISIMRYFSTLPCPKISQPKW